MPDPSRPSPADLIETDRTYFELEAAAEKLPGAVLAAMAQVAPLAAGCVVHRVFPSELPQIAEWIQAVETRVTELGFRWCRIYLDAAEPGLEATLAERGYRTRLENGFLKPPGVVGPSPALIIRPVVTDADWECKLLLHMASGEGSDGYQADSARMASAWVALERAKARCQEFVPFLARDDQGEPVASFCLLRHERLIRVKNLLVVPGARRRGVGTGCLRWIALEHPQRWVGAFSLQGQEAAEAMYRGAGFRPAGYQTEVMRPLWTDKC